VIARPRPHLGRPESGDSAVQSAHVLGRERKEVGVDPLYAEAAHDSQCDAAEWDAVTEGGDQPA